MSGRAFSTSAGLRARNHRMSLPIIGLSEQSSADASQVGLRRSAQGPSNSTLAKADYKMTRAHRASMGTVYFPGDVAWSLDDDGGDGDGGDDDDDEYDFPWWWFLVMPLEAVPCWIFGTALWAIIWPKTIQEMFGDKEKIYISGLLGTVSSILGWTAPFLGTLSDRFPQSWAKRCGRRRPFILAGQTICAISLLITYFTVHKAQDDAAAGRKGGHHTLLMLLITSQIIGSFGGNLEGPAWGAVWYDTIPARQRGLMRTVEGVLCTGCCMIGDLIGWCVGQHYVEAETIWLIYIGVEFYRIPMKLWACNGKAGWWQPERLPKSKRRKPVLDPHNPRHKQNCTLATLRSTESIKHCVGTSITETRTFFSAFEEVSFKWMWIQCFIGHTAGKIAWCFSYYWYQDCFPDGYWLFGWKIANNVQSLVSINGLIGNIIQLSIKWSGEWWRQRWGERPVCIWTGVLGFWATLSYPLYALVVPQPDQKYLYTLVLFWHVWGSIMGGISSVSGGVLWMGIMPSHEDGRAKNAARDNNVMGFHSRIPDTILPLFLGHAMSWFPTHSDGFNTFFWIGGSLGIVSYVIFVFMVHPRYEELNVKSFCGTRCQCTRKYFLREHDLATRARLKHAHKPTFMIDRLYPGEIEDPEAEPPALIDDGCGCLSSHAWAGRRDARRYGCAAWLCDALMFPRATGGRRRTLRVNTKGSADAALSSECEDGTTPILGQEGSNRR